MKRLLILVIAILAAINLASCTGMSDTQQRSLTGGLGGSAAGAAIGAMAGNAGLGAAIGAAAGTAGGYLYGKHKESEQRAYQQGQRDALQQQPPHY
ncbi:MULTISPECIES: glycine zipper domain-containing protein [unclassified Methylobacter]|uniref:glycine zipper domain-containing protein n=1 Tax=unclassified Methylobacter TaxID=2635283 RepID=UPI002F94D0DE